MKRSFAAAMLLAVSALPAAAASVIVTPGLKMPQGGSLECGVVNGDPAKSMTFIRQIVGYDGDVVFNPGGAESTLQPRNYTFGSTSDAKARFCVVTITSGSKKTARVTLTALTSGGAVAGTVSAQ